MSSPSLMASFGHSGSQAPQLMHSSVMTVDISGLAPYARGRANRLIPRARLFVKVVKSSNSEDLHDASRKRRSRRWRGSSGHTRTPDSGPAEGLLVRQGPPAMGGRRRTAEGL